MTDKDYIKTIFKMTFEELFEEVLENPTYISDSYYSDFGNAIYKRFDELKLKEKV